MFGGETRIITKQLKSYYEPSWADLFCLLLLIIIKRASMQFWDRLLFSSLLVSHLCHLLTLSHPNSIMATCPFKILKLVYSETNLKQDLHKNIKGGNAS